MKNSNNPMLASFAIAAAVTGLISTGWSQSQCYKVNTATTLSSPAEPITIPALKPAAKPVSRPVTTTLYDVVFTGKHYVAVGRWGTVLTSVDGVAWHLQGSDTDVNLRSVAAGASVVVAVGREGTVTVSPDGTRNWQRQYSGTTVRLLDVAYGNGLFVAVGIHGTIISSNDGRRWQNRTSGVKSNLHSVAYGGGKWLITGKATTLVSDDAKTWKPECAGIDSTCYGRISHVQGAFVMPTSSQCGIVRSDKDWTWESEFAAKCARLKGIAAGEKTLVAVGNRGVIVASSCRGRWKPCVSTTRCDLYSVAYGINRFVAVGACGTIRHSEDGILWKSAQSSR